MVKLAENKKSENRPIEAIPIPSRVYIPLSQHIGKICEPIVKVGESVLKGQKIAAVSAHVASPIHASISGKVAAIENWPHSLLGRCKAVVIESDGLDKAGYQHREDNSQIESLTAEQIRNFVLEAGVVGMGGASFPAHIKLSPPKPPETLIVNGAECEPYLTGDYRLMVERPKEILLGINLAAKCLGVKQVFIAIENNKPEAIRIFREMVNDGSLLLKGCEYKVYSLPSQYPQGAEKQLIKNILKKEIPRGKLPFDIKVVVHNVATLNAIYEAVYLAKPLYERVVTVTGSCFEQPKNILARIGTPIKELTAFCHPLVEEPAKIIIGGPMMGITQFSDSVPVIKSTNGVVLFSKKECKDFEENYCIRCGACVRECPVGLMPTLINLAARKEAWQEAKKSGALDCIECGICSYACPSKIRLVQSIKMAKLELMKVPY